MKSAIAYYRVSTQRQGRSGLGIEAQRATVARFAEAEGVALTAEYTEVETGKGADALDQSWSRFLRQVAKVDSMTRRTIHHEDAQTVHGRIQGEGRA